MLKLTRIQGPKTAPTLFIFAGGAGLSTLTVRSLDELQDAFSLVYADLPGCNDLEYDETVSFDSVVRDAVSLCSWQSGPVISVGHSFGGFFAAELALNAPVAGLVCLSTPFSRKTFSGLTDRYDEWKSPKLKEAEEDWIKSPSDKSFARWLSEYGKLYFYSTESQRRGAELLLTDPCCHQLFKKLKYNASDMERVLDELAHRDLPKLFLSESQGMISSDLLKQDAERGGFDFQIVRESSHFVMLDQPEQVARLIRQKFATGKGV